MREWFKEGVAAFERGVGFSISPYRSCTIQYFFWKAGWEEALRHDLATGGHPKQLGCRPSDET